VADLHEWLGDHGLERPVLVGHSMGGLAAMGYALTHPEVPHGLVVVDIAPRAYRPDFSREFAALSTDISRMSSRSEIDRTLEPLIPEEDVRQFLEMNAERANGGFRWKLNVEALQSSPFMNGPDFARFEEHLRGRSEAPALLIAGGESDFVREEDIPLFRSYFPNGSVEIIPGCGHWVHYICSDSFLKLLDDFLSRLS
jgi:esterase